MVETNDGGKVWSNKTNLSNTPKSDSQDVQIAAAGNNVYVTWWERNSTSNEPVMRISNDNGKSFGDLIMLSEK
jgi:hypothetical protein